MMYRNLMLARVYDIPAFRQLTWIPLTLAVLHGPVFRRSLLHILKWGTSEALSKTMNTLYN